MGIAVKSDELLFSSAQSIEVDYVSTRGDLGTFQLRTHKRWLSPNSRNVSILGITRILGRLEPARSAAEHVAALAKKFELLDEDSQALCRLMAAGQTQREIAELLHCTTRTIENRRNRIMVELGVSKPIDIVKFMVRLAEHGFISPDF
ncbi:MAG: LuxR C-terminal-related transcriptional regulator [Planctomycetaceae bacterium]